MLEPRRILVVKLATLGDLLTATPALRALRSSFPRAHIGVLATPSSAVALRGLDTLDEVLSFHKHAFDRPRDALARLPSAVGLGRMLRAGDWDTLVLLHHLTTPFGVAKYAALCLASGAPVRVGLDNGRGWFLTHAAEDHGFGWRHEVDYSLDVVEVLGAARPASPRLELVVAREDDAWAAACWADLGLAADQAVVALGPGSGAYSLARRWAPSRFVEVGRALLAQHGLTPVVLAGVLADEQTLAREVAAALGPAARVAPPAPTPQALAALLRRCRLLVANDSGPVHLATTVDTPVVAVFGPSNDRAWGPYPPDDPRHQVVREQLACSPCIHRGHAFGTPQGCPARTCLAILEPDAVLAAAERALLADQPAVPLGTSAGGSTTGSFTTGGFLAGGPTMGSFRAGGPTGGGPRAAGPAAGGSTTGSFQAGGSMAGGFLAGGRTAGGSMPAGPGARSAPCSPKARPNSGLARPS